MDEMEKNVMAPENTAQLGGNSEGKKPKKDIIKFVIPAAVCVVLVVIVACVAFATGVLGNKSDVVVKAMTKAFADSMEAMGDAWKIDGYENMFEDGQAYIEAELTAVDSVQVGMEINARQELYNAHMDIGYYGFSFLEADLYVDEDEILLGAPNLIDKVFFVDRTTFDEDIERLALEYDLEEEIVEGLKALNMGSKDTGNTNEELESAGKEIRDAVLDMMKETEVRKTDSKKLTVDGKARSCKGYVLTIAGNQAADVVLTCRDVYEGNESFRNYVNQMIMGMEGYASVEEMLEYDDPSKILEGWADELVKEGDTDIEFYIYKDVLAQIYCKDKDVVFEWNMEGGNFPLENMELSLSSDSTEFSLIRTGSMEGDKYLADYELDADGDESTLSIEKSKRDGDFRFELTDYYDEVLLEGGVREDKPGVEFTIEIDTLELDGEELLRGDILFSNAYEEEIVKPEGEKVNVMELTEDDWYDILWDISENLYY